MFLRNGTKNMKIQVTWDVMRCWVVNIYQHFRGLLIFRVKHSKKSLILDFLILKMMAPIYYTYSSACFAKAYHFIQENRKLEISLLHFFIFCSHHVKLCSGEIILWTFLDPNKFHSKSKNNQVLLFSVLTFMYQCKSISLLVVTLHLEFITGACKILAYPP